MRSYFSVNKNLVGISLALSLACTVCPALSQSSASQDESAGGKSLKLLDESPEATTCLKWADNTVEPKAIVLCIHGLGLHKGTYEGFGEALSKQGVLVYALDMRGFGGRKEEKVVDFDGSLADIKFQLELLKKEHPSLPVVMLGESMGGAVALHAAAFYPDLVSGLISSVPSGDRFNSTDTSLKIGVHAIFSGFNKPMDLNEIVIDSATKKPELRDAWKNDPLVVSGLTPNQLIAFQSFMKQNFEAAKAIKNIPVLFIQGANDKLVRPAGTWKLFEAIAAPNRQLVLSKTSEHLIFEENQFSKEDLSFVCTWIDKNVAKLDDKVMANLKEPSTVASAAAQGAQVKEKDARVKPSDRQSSNQLTSSGNDTTPLSTGSQTASTDKEKVAAAPVDTASSKDEKTDFLAAVPAPNAAPSKVVETSSSGIKYWIELLRDGKIYRCNNKSSFKSGDSIRFHIIPESDGYVYVVMKAGSTGKSAVLFPSAKTGINNHLSAGQDCPVPSANWLKFDVNPGVEKVRLLYSEAVIDPSVEKDGRGQSYVTAYVAPGTSGAKDLVPTRMQLTWDDPNPVIIPDDFSGRSQLASSSGNTSLVRLISNNLAGVMAIDIALDHR